MADLIIKPLAGAGNTVKIQDQAGGSILTSADSGATIANATLNSPTLVTPALGTVATGNLSNTAIVYPSGHVLQVQNTVLDVSVHTQYDYDQGTGWPTTSWKVALTTKQVNSTHIMWMDSGSGYNELGTTGDDWMGLRWKKYIGSTETDISPGSTGDVWIAYTADSHATSGAKAHLSHSPAVAAGTQIDYRLYVGNWFNHHTGFPITIFCMEIA